MELDGVHFLTYGGDDISIRRGDEKHMDEPVKGHEMQARKENKETKSVYESVASHSINKHL